ncbi:hypothetical protein [Curtobacterium sp. ME26]|uniref:hypothetical protein n=1 Tax=Curtobacterium sp. ME26 TaxID=2744254 RepID=UPI0015F6AA2E|nr:hypothetical protein [Curtobacterium sp. ME26]
MTVRRARTLRAALATAGIVALAACSSSPAQEGTAASDTDEDAAKEVWRTMNAEVESSQDVVGSGWLASDTAARACGTRGVQWVINRYGPATTGAERTRVLDDLERRWTALGWQPVRAAITGDAPGQRLRYPATRSLDDGFFVEFGTTEHGSTLQLQTPCTPGDITALNTEKYAERHTNTPPDVPGATPSSTPSDGAGS